MEPVLVNAHRRLGKSFYPLLLCLERCLSKPGIRCVYGGPTYEQVREIVLPSFDWILQTAPPELRPKSRGYQFTFRNPRWKESGYSVFRMAGVDLKHGDNLRGAFMDVCVLDEVRDMRELKYIVQDVVTPQFVDRESPLLLLITTPPRTNDHDWVQYFRPRAAGAGRYLVIPGSENPDFNVRDREMLRVALGAEEGSIAWEREVECKLITDPEDLICPEFAEFRDKIVVEKYPKPEFYFPLTCMDTGYDPDHTAILYGYVDWLNQYLVIEDETFRRRMTLLDINKAVRKKENKLFKDSIHPARRYADIEKRGLVDLQRMFKLYFKAADKYHSEAALSRMRAMVRQGKLKIRSRCTRLIDQLENGIWNKNRTDYERTAVNGHWDAGKALVYLARMAKWMDSPLPDGYVDKDRSFRLDPIRRTGDTFKKALGR